MADRHDESRAGTAALQPPRDLSHHFSRVTKARKGNSIKQLYKYMQTPGIGNLAGGLPNASYFPYDTLEAQTARPDRFVPTPNGPSGIDGKAASLTLETPDTSASSHIVVPHAAGTTNPLEAIDLTTALQYGLVDGYPPLLSFIRQFARESLHPNIPYLNGPDVILSCGNTDGYSKVIQAFSNEWNPGRDWVREREGILCEEFAYLSGIQASQPRGLQVVPVKVDGQGMLASGPGGLEDVLQNWDERKGKRPHLLYTITIGQNPTGGVLSVQRRKELYALCSKFDVLIIEDDPYFCLQYPFVPSLEASARGLPVPAQQEAHSFPKSSGFPFIDSLVPSYLQFDTDGRVIRLDTFSKTIAPGCRLGWITAQPPIIERIVRIAEASTAQPSGFVQAMIAELIIGPQPAPAKADFARKSRAEQRAFTGWKVDGWVRWLEGLRGGYERRMQRMCNILEDGRFQLKQGTPLKPSESDWAVISKTEMYSFDWPRGGMFLWVQMHFDTHPLASQVPSPKLSHIFWIYLTQKPNLLLVAPGEVFSPTPEIAEKEAWKYLRLCFAAVDEPDIQRVSERFARAANTFWAIKSRKELEDIEDEDEEALTMGEKVDMFNLGGGMGC